jgi:hypothetical protein
MAQHGLHLDATDLAAELRRPLVKAGGASSIDRTISGFEDFSPMGTAAIEPGDPARSLLYHALASLARPRRTRLRGDRTSWQMDARIMSRRRYASYM